MVRSLHSKVPTGIVALVENKPLFDLEASPPTSSFLSQTVTFILYFESSLASAHPTAPAPIISTSVFIITCLLLPMSSLTLVSPLYLKSFQQALRHILQELLVPLQTQFLLLS